MQFSVYYIEFSDTQVRKLNTEGWNSPLGSAYLSGKEGRNIKTAMAFGLVNLAFSGMYTGIMDPGGDRLTVNEQVWTALQNGVPNKPAEVHATFSKEKRRSMDVGDIIVWEDGQTFRCSSFGFDKFEF